MMSFLVPLAHAQSTLPEPTGAGNPASVQAVLRYIVTHLDNWLAGLVVLVVFYVLSRMVSRMVKERIVRERGESVQESSLILVGRIVRITITGIGLTIALAINGLNFTAVIGALSLGIGFALKDIISNFISSVVLLSQKRIHIGDMVQIGQIIGTIISIDTRVTTIQSIDGTAVVVPNHTMLSETIISYTSNPFRRIDLDVGVAYDTNLPMVTSLIRGVIEQDKSIVPKPEALILVDKFGDSSININIKFWIESSANWLKAKSNLANKIKKAFDEVGVQIPFPIRTLKLDEDDRSFLKTMDSLKKGVVPSSRSVPTPEALKTAAQHAGNAPPVPASLFFEEEASPVPTYAPTAPPATFINSPGTDPVQDSATEKPHVAPPGHF